MIRHQQGFTLLEVLVALAVLSVALGALIKASAQSTENITYLRDKTLASWVASNKINEMLLIPGWPGLGESKGEEAMAGREWRWQIRVSNTADRDIRRLDVRVSLENDLPLVELAAFKGRG